MKYKFFLLIALFLVTACATKQLEPTSTPLSPTETSAPPTEPPSTPLPEPTNTSIPPTQIPQPIEVTYDGFGCTVTGPTEVPAGTLKTFFIDQSDMDTNVSLWLVNLDDGKTTQDMIDGQPEPGVWWPKASWVHHDGRRSSQLVESEDGRVVATTWYLSKVGEHTLICMQNPEIIWIAGPLMVVESPSD